MGTKVAIITGITGQDGSYLAEFLLSKNYVVHGLIRRSSDFNTRRIDHLYADKHTSGSRLLLHYWDLLDVSSISRLINEIKPDEIYNLAAQSHVQVSFQLPSYTSMSTGVSTVSILEAIKSSGLPTKFYQASSSELFGSTPPPQNEESPFRPQSPYAVAKLMAYWTTVNYRTAYGIHATNGILFNHESPRRGKTFVTRKISRGVADIVLGKQEKIYLGNLDSIRDWGYAKEYVESMWLMLQQDQPSDYVIATGEGASVKDFLIECFSHVGLDWKQYVEIDPDYFRPNEVNALIGDYSKAESNLGWRPRTNWKKLAQIMVDFDLSER